MDLEALAARGVGEFLFVGAPLNIVGATGAPIRPLALLGPGPAQENPNDRVKPQR